MARLHMALGVLFSLAIPAGAPPSRPPPLPRGEPTPLGPLRESWTRKTTRLTASQVGLSGVGVRTHANWILFRLPFDATATDRVRNVRFTPTASTDTNVAALQLGSVC